MDEIITEGDQLINTLKSEYNDKNPRDLITKEVITQWHDQYKQWYHKCLLLLEKNFFNDKLNLPSWFKIQPLDLSEPIQTYSTVKEFETKLKTMKEMRDIVASIPEESFEDFLVYQGSPHQVKMKLDDIMNELN